MIIKLAACLTLSVWQRLGGHSATLLNTQRFLPSPKKRSGLKNLFGSVQNPHKLGLSIATRSGRINNQERPYRPAWTTANEVWTVGTTFYTTFARTRTNLLDIPGRSTAAESTELYYGAVLTTMASFSTASFFQMSCNTALGQPIDFLRDVSELRSCRASSPRTRGSGHNPRSW